jgi:8-oxo-dGTP pyrophosphatase MutT (NUDIX family)
MKSPAEEIVQIVDRNNIPVQSLPRGIMRQQGLTHRASYILVFNAQGHIFIQKRTLTKDIYPGFWDIAAGGVVLAAETYDESAVRELHEELGISATPLTELFDHYYEAGENKVWGRVYRCCHEGPFILQKEEVQYGRFAAIEEILRLHTVEPFTPDGIQILERIQHNL